MFWRGVLGYLPVNLAQGLVGLLTIVVFTRLLSPADYAAKISKETKELAEVVSAANIKAE